MTETASTPAQGSSVRGSRGPRGPYAKTAATRGAILDAALEVFGQTGYHKGSLREIAARIGISEAGVLHHFPSKRALLLAALERRDDVDRPAVISSDDEQQGRQLLRSIVALVDRNMRRPGVVELYATLAGEATHETHPAHEFFTHRYVWVVDTIEAAFAALARDGGLRPGVGPRSAARQLVALMDGLQIQWLYAGERFDMAGEVLDFLNLVLLEPLDPIERAGAAEPAAEADQSSLPR